MGDAVLDKFLKLRGVIADTKTKEQQQKNKEYIVDAPKVNMLKKLIEIKPKEKYIVKYFQEKLKQLDEGELDD